MQKPVVALDNGGAREVIENNKSGLLSNPQDIDQLAQNILTLINDPDMRLRMGKYGRKQAATQFTPERMTHDMEHIYNQILKPARQPALSH